ncbi:MULTISPECIES: hypothetical protein [unclassified Streptomyces]|uniref:hypothetical protein n=1 Tax=unclassified Streptomyces TaxID=2593676 RepID=UPI000DC7D5E1|nr:MULTISPECIES: hypothetical protein [unclassified Streptomyces]AWZ08756.1 hypothetical protein DRB89_34130 [Streptomyces sp. ICC4]AWZ15021.1 hypothetical protein DRB96_25275 [Streptomyces sp. ICC1]
MAPNNRPKDWQPLAGSDPTPGNPEEVRTGAKNMATTGEQIRAQITRLKAISGTDELKGKYVEELKKGSGKLKGKLEKSAGRYEKVSAKLGEWAGCLEHAQSETAAALTSAKEAQESFRALVGSEDPDSAAAKTAEKDLEPSKKTELESARTKLEGAKKRNGTAVEGYRKDSKRIADKIRDIIDDAVEDGFWSWFSNLIERNLKAIKVVLEVMGWIATILAVIALVIMIVAMFAVPGAGWLAAMALMTQIGTALALASTVAHVAMAATGNGGWGDVVFDVVGLLTMRMGTVAGKGIKKGSDAARQASVKAGRQQAKDVKTSPAYKDKIAKFEERKANAGSQRARDAIQKEKDAFVKSQKPKGVATEMPKPSRMDTFRAGGDRDAAAQLKFARNEALKRGGDPATSAAARAAGRNGGLAFGTFAAGNLIDWTDKGIAPSDIYEDKPKVGPYGDLKDWTPSDTGMYDYAP